jgi:hypothetical protein
MVQVEQELLRHGVAKCRVAKVRRIPVTVETLEQVEAEQVGLVLLSCVLQQQQ